MEKFAFNVRRASVPAETSGFTLGSAVKDSPGQRIRQVLLLIAILHQAYYCYRFPFAFTDKSYQTAAAISVTQGEMFLVPRGNADDLSKSTREPLSFFPLGYPVLLVPFLMVFEGTFWPAFVVDVLAISVYFISWYMIVDRCSSFLSSASRTFLWMMWAFGMSPLIVGASSDIVAEAFFSGGLALLFGGVLRERPSVGLVAVAGFSTGIAATIRYAYWPLMAVVPVTAFVTARGLPRTRRITIAGAAALTAAVPWAVQVASQKFLSGRTSFLSATSIQPAEPYWHHLQRFFPFPIAPLGIDKLARKAELAAGLPAGTATFALWIVSLVLVLCAIRVSHESYKRLMRRATAKEWLVDVLLRDQRLSTFVSAASTTIALTIAMLIGLSLKTDLIPSPWTTDGLWTYVQEPRYYLTTSAFLLLIYSATAFAHSLESKFAVVSRNTLLATLTGSLVVCSVGRAGADVGWINSQNEWTTAEGLADDRIIRRTIHKIGVSRGPVFYCDSNYGRSLVAMACGAHLIGGPHGAAPADPQYWKTSRPIRVIVALHHGHPPTEERLRDLVRELRSPKIAALHDADLYFTKVSATLDRSRIANKPENTDD